MTDYIFGDGEVVFDNCTLNFCGYSDGAVGGYITATRNDQKGTGYLFNECTITGTNENGITAPAGKYGRPWSGTSTVYFVNSIIKGNVIDDAGWGEMNNIKPANVFYYEYNNKTEDGTAVVSEKGKALTDEDVKAMSIKSFLGGWTPKNYTGNEIVIGGKDPVKPDPEPGTSTAALGDVDQNGTYTANDAALALSYVLDKANANLTATQIDAAEVNGDKIVTAVDVSQILAKVLDNSFVFTRKDYNPETSSTTTTEKATEATTEKATEATTEKVTDATTEKTSDTSSEETTEPSGDTKPVIWTLGDSTVCNYEAENVANYNYRQGWGMRLGDYFTEDVTVKDIAISGRGTRDFPVYDSGKNYKDFTTNVKPGDYVLIQFGHNDQKEPLKAGSEAGTYVINGNYGKTDANGGISSAAGLKDWKNADENGYLTIAGVPSVEGTCTEGGKLPSFEWLLYNKYVKVALDKGAIPVLVTPIVRANGNKNASGVYDTLNKIDQTHENVNWKVIGPLVKDENLTSMNYIQAVKDVAAYAKEQGYDVPVIDLYADSCDYWTQYIADHGTVNALHANDKGKVGVKDRTHLSRLGAFAASGLVAKEIKEQNLGLAKYLKETFPTAPLDGISAGDDDTTAK